MAALADHLCNLRAHLQIARPQDSRVNVLPPLTGLASGWRREYPFLYEFGAVIFYDKRMLEDYLARRPSRASQQKVLLAAVSEASGAISFTLLPGDTHWPGIEIPLGMTPEEGLARHEALVDRILSGA